MKARWWASVLVAAALVLRAAGAAAGAAAAARMATQPPGVSGCRLGPAYWCGGGDAAKRIAECGLSSTTVGSCGYLPPADCVDMTVAELCANASLNATNYAGGIGSAPSDLFAWFTLATVWAPGPAGCPPYLAPGGPEGYCNQYTNAGTYASIHLWMHGMWPSYGSAFPAGIEPAPPTYAGLQAGWPEYCAPSKPAQALECDMGLPIHQCPAFLAVVSPSSPLRPDLEKHWPGLLGDSNTTATNYSFAQNEIYKHSSCAGRLAGDLKGYVKAALRAAQRMVGARAPITKLLSANLNGTVANADLAAALGKSGAAVCSGCVLSGVNFCLKATRSGRPGGPTECPASEFASSIPTAASAAVSRLWTDGTAPVRALAGAAAAAATIGCWGCDSVSIPAY